MTSEINIVVILLAICLAGMLSQKSKLMPPISFMLCGVLIGLLPEFESIKLEPEWILVIFLPPILMEAAFFTSLRDFKANIRSISQLAVGLVFVTSFGIAYIFNLMVPEAGLIVGLVLGAIISPSDAVASLSILKQVKVPKRIVTIIEGESLVNDAMGLVLYKFALAAIATASISISELSIQFLIMALAGTAIGLAIGFIFIRIFPKFNDESVALISTFVPPYGAYIVAESFHVSGVLAVVAAGLYVGWHAPRQFTPQFRIIAESFWKTVIFIMNALVFLLIGIEMPNVMQSIYNFDQVWLLKLTLAICFTTVGIRFIYVFAFAYLIRLLVPAIRKQDPMPKWQNVFIISWTGVRGIVTLATALALPTIILQNGEKFLYRDLIIFISVCVILFTLVFQGLTMPWVVKKLRLAQDYTIHNELWQARMDSAKAALKKLEDIDIKDCSHHETLSRLISHYRDKITALGDGPFTSLNEKNDHTVHPLIESENNLWREALSAERNTLLEMRRRFVIGDDVMHEILREIDLLALRFR